MLCPKCHSLLTKGAKYCDICGTRISQEDIQVEEVGSRVKNREKHKKEVRKKTKNYYFRNHSTCRGDCYVRIYFIF